MPIEATGTGAQVLAVLGFYVFLLGSVGIIWRREVVRLRRERKLSARRRTVAPSSKDRSGS